jgi:hypothetical protein
MAEMKAVYAVRTVPVVGPDGTDLGWVRADPFADGSSPTDVLYLRDGSACDQSVALARIAADRSLLYRTREEASRDGLARLRAADRTGRLANVPRVR